MKDAMGELNMTVITIVAIGAVAAFFMMVLWPNIQNSINNTWNNNSQQCPTGKTWSSDLGRCI